MKFLTLFAAVYVFLLAVIWFGPIVHDWIVVMKIRRRIRSIKY